MTAPRRSKGAGLTLALRYALRDLIGDPRGFGLFIACIVIGVAAISGVSGLSRSIAQGLAREGRTILGGDVSFTLTHRQLAPDERAFLETRGRVGEVALMRAMARRDDGEAALVEIKAVDPAAYPSFGALELEPAQPLADALRTKDGAFGLAADPLLIARLDAKIGDSLTIGAARFELRAALRSEPDKLSGGIGFGPRVLMGAEAFRATGLAQPGTIVRYVARMTLPGVASDEDVSRFAKEAEAAFPRAGWEIRKRDGVSPQFSRNLERFSQLLTLVALTALVAGGAGVANAVNGLVERKRQAYAILKALGAPASRVFTIALMQVLLVASLAILLGLVLGACLPLAGAKALRELADLPVAATLDASGLAMGALYGLLVTLVFAVGPLGRAHDVPVAALLRDEIDAAPRPLRPRYRIASALAMLALAATVLLSSADLKLTATYGAAAVMAALLLRGVAALVVRAARALPHARDARLRFAQANIRRPKGLAPALIASIGLTQTLLVSLALVEGAIHKELSRDDTLKIPRFYFIDAPREEAQAFQAFLEQRAPGARIEHVPMMRGRIVAVKGARAASLRVGDDAAWALRGDRGVTFSAGPPANSDIVEGEWWSADHTGAPLVSLEAGVAKGLGLSLGDEITVNVLGREITARVANLRRVQWLSYGINFVLVFTPNAFKDAPYSELFTIAYDGPDADARDAKITREAAKRFPMIAAIRVKDALEAADKIASQLALAARAASGVAIATAMLALASAVAATQTARLHDAVVLKVLGATRPWLASAYAMEFAMLGVVASLFATIAGSGAAYAIVEGFMKLDFVFQPGAVAGTTLGALAITIALGLLGTWRALAEKPGPRLREL